MNTILIFVAGIPGGGKTTFAKYVASEWCIPLFTFGDNMIIVNTNSFDTVSYEAIMQKIQKLVNAD